MFGDNCGYMHGISCISIVETQERSYKDDKRSFVEEKIEEKSMETCDSSSSTSSIGNNSDVTQNSIDNFEDSEEVQSSYKSSLEAMEALEEVLPIRRGISRFYNGKSKSFASLANVESIKNLPKPENAFSRRRRNLLACNLSCDKSRNFQLRTNSGGISKRVSNSRRTTIAVAVAVAMNSSAVNSGDNLNSGDKKGSGSVSPHFHPQFIQIHTACSPSPGSNFSACRSFSLADLHE